MSTCHIRRRTTSKGERRYDVRFRRGGSEAKLEHAGTFKTEREARLRRDLIAGWLALGLNPRAELARLLAAEEPAAVPTYQETAATFAASRVDLSPGTLRAYDYANRRVSRTIGDRDPHTLTVRDMLDLVANLAVDLEAATVAAYMSVVKQTLDFAGVAPNPARDRRVRLPVNTADEVAPPTARQVLAILERVPSRFVLPLVVLEQTGMRVGELAKLPWGDVDVASARFRLSRSRTKTKRPRWVQVPEWLMVWVADSCPVEDRVADRRVFPDATEGVLRGAMARACVTAGVPAFSPHDLRHRRTSLWHGQGIPARELADRIGHARPSMTLDRYSHVMDLEEVPQESFEQVLVRHR